MTHIKIKGVIPPMITPFLANEDIDYDGHIANVLKWNQSDLAGYLILGSNSETPFLSEAEKLKLIEVTVESAVEDRILLVGSGMPSARETIALTNKAARLGAHAALLLTPSYYGGQMDDTAQINYFTTVADHSEIPVLIYNVTKFTHVSISPKAVGVLSSHPNIIGMKDSSGSIPQLVNYLDVIDEDFNLMVGTVSAWFPALTLGIKAGVFALANCAPDECALIQNTYEEGDLENAKNIYTRIFPVNTAVTATYGVAGLKYACALRGYHGGHVRNPLRPLSDQEKGRIKTIMSRAQLI
jgi:4-hydroxy-2-oxoglutarate aldolase